MCVGVCPCTQYVHVGEYVQEVRECVWMCAARARIAWRLDWQASRQAGRYERGRKCRPRNCVGVAVYTEYFTNVHPDVGDKT